MKRSVLLDTSFFIRLLNAEDPLHPNARDYYKYFLGNDVLLKVSTISIAEYCVRGTADELPLKNIQIVPFNLDHAKRTGEFARIVFKEKGNIVMDGQPRAIIPNDSKLFAQADLDESIQYFVTSDTRSKAIYNLLQRHLVPRFEILDITIPYHQVFGILDL